MFSGFMLAHVPHWTMIDTMAWLPAVLACLVRADSTLRPRWGALGGLALGVAFLAGHPQLFYHVVLATVALGLTLVARRAAAAEPWRRLATILLLVPAVALGVSAVQLIPSWEVAVASHRAGLGYDWKTTGSLLPGHLAQALLPWGLFTVGSWRTSSSEFYLYPGVLPLILAVHTLTRRWDWRVGFHAVLGFVAVLLAFGDHYGLYRPTYDLLPGLTLFRIPARFVGLAGFAVAILAGPRRAGARHRSAAARPRPRQSAGWRWPPPPVSSRSCWSWCGPRRSRTPTTSRTSRASTCSSCSSWPGPRSSCRGRAGRARSRCAPRRSSSCWPTSCSAPIP